MASSSPQSLRGDLLAAYLAAGARVFAWAAVSRLVFGGGAHVAEFALLALIRSTIGVLNYTGVGLAPALVHFGSLVRHGASAAEDRPQQLRRLYASALATALWLAMVGLLIACAYAIFFPHLHRVPTGLLRPASMAALLMAVGLVVRLMSDAPSAWLQSSGHFRLDNLLLAGAELFWVLLTAALLRAGATPLPAAALGFAVSSLALLLARRLAAGQDPELRSLSATPADPKLSRGILAFGALITLSQLADFLYAPINCILINRMLPAADLAAYTLALQVDAALLLLATGIGSAALPRAAALFAKADSPALRRLYWQLTLLTLLMVALAALAAWLLAPWWLPLWLKADMPAGRAILPWVLIHTVIGASGAAGRAILIAAGRARTLGLATLVAGAANVLLAFLLLRYTDLGLKGVALATIILVTARALAWMPWYVMRMTRTAP
jgi:membrane protein EpsK